MFEGKRRCPVFITLLLMLTIKEQQWAIFGRRACASIKKKQPT